VPPALIVLGAADGSLSTYRTARAMGFRTICVDMRPSAPGVPLADEFLPISTREPEPILAALGGREDVAGVLAPSTDIALPTLRALTHRLGLPDVVSEPAARASVDKRFFRDLCDGLGLPSYRWAAGFDGVDALTYPLVIKPVDAQSSRGVTRCATPLELGSAVAEARRLSYAGAVVIEEAGCTAAANASSTRAGWRSSR
jgi:formate-dependent phosphoribosylglycinamide formyltransferase (GAR transformylase)